MANPIIDELKCLAEWNLTPRQSHYFKTMYADAKAVEVSRLSDVLTPAEISIVRKVVNPKAGRCYRNAIMLASLFPDRCRYVEGFGWDSCFKVEHAFNLIDGKYVDVTWELALEDDVTKMHYVALVDADYSEILDDVAEHDYTTGDYYLHTYLRRLEAGNVGKGSE